MLTLEIELLTSVYRAGALDGTVAEWPPHPERVYSALVQAWGDGGGDPEERRVLEWLEALPAPRIEASDALEERDAPPVYVPPNDIAGDKLEALPDRRKRYERTFRVVAPADPVVRFHWDVDSTAQQRAALDALARRVASLGHSASLVRCRFSETQRDVEPSRTWIPAPNGMVSLRVPYAGRLADLERWYRAGRRPQSRYTVRYADPARAASAPPVAETVFGGPEDWFVFEDAGGFRPDLSAFAHVSRRLRDALMSVAQQPVPEVISGHAPDGQPSTRPHLAIVPLANVGWEWSTGDLLGVAVVLPRALASDQRRGVVEALGKLVRFQGDVAQMTLRLGREHEWLLERSATPSRASLMPGRWCREARVWASATPVLLDRFPDDPVEEATIVATACRHIGLPEPIEIELHKHSALAGAPSVYDRRPGGATGWTFPRDSRLAERIRRHVVLFFREKVRGPVLIGAGRYHGFGLCLPIDAEQRR